MIKINLIPRSYVEKIYSSFLIAKIVFGLILVLIIVAVFSVYHYKKFIFLNDYLTHIKIEQNQLQKEIEEAKKIEKDIEEINNYVAAFEKINKNRFVYVAFMQDIINNLPQTMWFNGIDTRTRLDGIEVTINLNSNTLEDLLWWYAFLEKNPRFSDVKITDINYNNSYYNTQMSLKYNYFI